MTSEKLSHEFGDRIRDPQLALGSSLCLDTIHRNVTNLFFCVVNTEFRAFGDFLLFFPAKVVIVP